ncbi:MAG TPA: asparaginase [Vicinamibacterales bacterium]|nr:asparaginase [Vicinamibacterales bacterium]
MHIGSCLVEALRGGEIESVHRVHIAVAHAERGLIASAGNPAHHSFVRSSIKMFQVLPFVEAGGVERFHMSGEELALCTASHGGEAFHVAAARAILSKARVTEAALACGPHLPLHEPTAHAMLCAGEAPGPIHNNCSGKHAGMLAHCVQQQWVTDGYHRPSHPMQQRVVSTLGRWMRIDSGDMTVAIDGCGLPTFGIALDAVAEGCARLAAAVASGEPSPTTVFSAMVSHPEYVAGTDRLDTDLMRAANKTLFAKVGAEGFYCAGVPSMRLGAALKVEDGSKRAAEPALLAVLAAIDAIGAGQRSQLSKYSHPDIVNTRQEVVGQFRVRLNLAR